MYIPTLYGCDNFSEYYRLWGQALNAMHKYRQTIHNLPAATAINPNFSAYSLAFAYGKVGDFSNAINEYELLMVNYPDDPVLPLRLGETYLRMEDYRKAQQLLGKAVRLNPEDASAHFFYGRSLLLLGRKPAARRELQKAVKLDPGGEVGKLAGNSLKLAR
jgi:tetratricopeptide (TPR) repeat protein